MALDTHAAGRGGRVRGGRSSARGRWARQERMRKTTRRRIAYEGAGARGHERGHASSGGGGGGGAERALDMSAVQRQKTGQMPSALQKP